MKLHEHNKEMYGDYVSPDVYSLQDNFLAFRYFFKTFCNFFNYKQSDFSIDEKQIIQILIRVDQRKLHYKMYHDGLMINELKETAVLGYWILKYKPILHFNGKIFVSEDWNERFIIFLFMSSVNQYKNLGLNPLGVVSKKLLDDIQYTLSHRLISYDSMTILLEALAE